MKSSGLMPGNQTTSATEPVPYDIYAALLRLVLTDLRRICFGNAAGRISWISEGEEDPGLAALIGQVVRDAARSDESSHVATYGHGTAHVFIVRDKDGNALGVLATVFENQGYQMQAGHELAARLMPVLKLLQRDLQSSNRAAPKTTPAASTSTHRDVLGAAARVKSAPVLLRRSLSIALDKTPCAFGALIAADARFTFLHHGSESQLQVDMRGIIDALRRPLAEHMSPHADPVVLAAPTWAEVAAFQLIVCPVRNPAGKPVALLVLLRRRHQSPFETADAASLQDIATQIPAAALRELVALPAKAPSKPQPSGKVAAAPTVEQTASIDDTGASSVSNLLRAALRDGRFELHAQLLSPLHRESDTCRYEVLLRLNVGDELQTPDAFLQSASSAGLLPEIDRWVIGQLLRTLRPHADALKAGKWEFAVNISGASLLNASFVEFIEAQLFRSPVPPQSIVLEFSESDVLANKAQFELLAKRLAQTGCRIALDNCRQGLDIFFAVGRLTIHRLKIDAALTRELTNESRAGHVVRELVEVARDIGIETVGEQIENDATCERLRELGVDLAQGRGISAPQPLVEILRQSDAVLSDAESTTQID